MHDLAQRILTMGPSRCQIRSDDWRQVFNSIRTKV